MTLQTTNFTGHLLVAMPSLNDAYFAKSVTYICTHTQDGAMGIMINRPMDMSYEHLFGQINLTLLDRHLHNKPVLLGGPVQPERGFILHPHASFDDSINHESENAPEKSHGHQQEWDSSITINNHTALTTSKDILEAVANNMGPSKMLLSLGYAGWVPGQLEQEISQNAWLSVVPKSTEALHTILFDTPHEAQLDAALAQLGVRYDMLSDIAGHA